MNPFKPYLSLLWIQIKQQAYALKVVVLIMTMATLGIGIYLQHIRLPAEPLSDILSEPNQLIRWVDYHEERANALLPLNGLQFAYDPSVSKEDQTRLTKHILAQEGIVTTNPDQADFLLYLHSPTHTWVLTWNPKKPKPLWDLAKEEQPLERRLAYLFYLEHQSKMNEVIPPHLTHPKVIWRNYDLVKPTLSDFDLEQQANTDASRRLTIVLLSLLLPGLLLFGFGPTLVGIEWDQRRSAGELEVWALSTRPMWWLFSTQMLSYALWSGLPITALLLYYALTGSLGWMSVAMAWIALHSLSLLMGHLNLLSTVLFRHRYGRMMARVIFNPFVALSSAFLQYTLFSYWAQKAKQGILVETDLHAPFFFLFLGACVGVKALTWLIECRIGILREGLRQV